YCNVACTLQWQGAFAPALAAMQRGHELGSQRPDWPYPSAEWVKHSQRLVELDRRLSRGLRGDAGPARPGAQWEVAQLYLLKKLYGDAARLWRAAFTADPALAENLELGHRYYAACAAALAANGQGADAERSSESERSQWREQALAWLRADLAAKSRLAKNADRKHRSLLQRQLLQWQYEPDLASLRDSASVTQLANPERIACQQVWADVQALLTALDTDEQVDRRR